MRRQAILITLAHHHEILKKYAFEREIIRVGRDPQCDVRLPSTTVSRIHCKIKQAGDAYVVIDNGSTNGIRLDGRATTESKLETGNVIEIENYRLWISFASVSDDPPPADSIEGVLRTLPSPNRGN